MYCGFIGESVLFVFVGLGDVVKALRVLEGRGGSAPIEVFTRMWGLYAFSVLNTALDWGLVERRGGVYALSGRGRALLRLLTDRCPVEARAARGRLWLKTPLGLYPVAPMPSYMLSLAYKLAEACGEEPRRTYVAICRALAKATARGLDRWIAAWGSGV